VDGCVAESPRAVEGCAASDERYSGQCHRQQRLLCDRWTVRCATDGLRRLHCVGTVRVVGMRALPSYSQLSASKCDWWLSSSVQSRSSRTTFETTSYPCMATPIQPPLERACSLLVCARRRDILFTDASMVHRTTW